MRYLRLTFVFVSYILVIFDVSFNVFEELESNMKFMLLRYLSFFFFVEY